MKGADLEKFFEEKSINKSKLAAGLGKNRSYWKYWYNQEKVDEKILLQIAEFLKIDIAILHNYPPKKKKSSTSTVNEDDTAYGKGDYKDKYYTCVEETGKLKSRLIEVLEENRTLRIKLTT